MDNLCCLAMDGTMSASKGGWGCCENFIKTPPSLASSRKRQARMEGRERHRGGGRGGQRAPPQSDNHIFLSR